MDYYRILGVGMDAGSDEIKRAFRTKALEYHPDRVPEEKKKWAHKKFIEIGTACEVLLDPDMRDEYNDFLLGIKGVFKAPNVTAEDVEERIMQKMFRLPGFENSFEDWDDFKYKMKRDTGLDLDKIIAENRKEESEKRDQITDRRKRR